MKKIIAILLIVSTVFMLCACGANPTSTESYTPPVQGGFEPMEEIDVEDVPIENEGFVIQTPVPEDASPAEIFRTAHGYLHDANGIIMDYEIVDDGDVKTVSVHLNNTTGEVYLRVTEDDECEELYVIKNVEGQYTSYFIETWTDSDYYSKDVYAEIGRATEELEEFTFLFSRIEHLLVREKATVSINGAPCVVLRSTTPIDDFFDEAFFYINQHTGKMEKMRLVDNDTSYYISLKYEGVDIVIPSEIENMNLTPEEDDYNIPTYSGNFFYKSPYEYKGFGAFETQLGDYRISYGAKAEFLDLTLYPSLEGTISDKANIINPDMTLKEISLSDPVASGTYVIYGAASMQGTAPNFLGIITHNPTPETIAQRDCTIVGIISIQEENPLFILDLFDPNSLGISDLVAMFGPEYEKIQVSDDEDTYLLAWGKSSTAVFLVVEEGEDSYLLLLPREMVNQALHPQTSTTPKAPLTSASTFSIDGKQYVLGETRLKNIQGDLKPYAELDVLEEQSVYRKEYTSDTTKALFGTSQDDGNNTICYYSITESSTFSMSNGLSFQSSIKDYLATFGDPDKSYREGSLITYVWMDDTLPYNVSLTCEITEDNYFVKYTELTVINYLPLIGDALQSSFGEYLLEGLLKLGESQ